MINNKYFLGLDEVSAELNAGVDKSLKNEYIAHFANALNCKTLRVWLNTKEIITIGEDDEIQFNAEGLTNLHNYIHTMRKAGVERFLLLDWGFVYPYGYIATDKWVVPDPKTERGMYIRFLLLQQRIRFEIARNFTFIEYFESTNEPDGVGGTFLHKNGFHFDGKNNEGLVYTRDEIEDIILDLNYFETLGVKAANKDAKMLLPSFCNLDYSPQYLDDLYTKIESGKYPTIGRVKSKRIESFFEILNWHPYNMVSVQINDDWIKSQKKIRDVILKHGDGERKVWYTEIGWSDFKREDEKHDIGKRFNDFLSYVNDNMPWVETVFPFRLFNLSNEPETEGEDNFGLVYNEYDWYSPLLPKPSIIEIYKFMNGNDAPLSPLYKYASSKERELFPNEVIGEEDDGFNVLILGNHIAYQKNAPWNKFFESRGMDASTSENDFAHVLHGKIKKTHAKTQTTVIDMRNWETCFYCGELLEELGNFTKKKYDLVIVRLGENVGEHSFIDHPYKDGLLKLCKLFEEAKTRFVFTNTFNGRKDIDEHQKIVADILKAPYVDISQIGLDVSCVSTSDYPNHEYKVCPNDEGMRRIAEAIYEAIGKISNK